MEAHRNFRHSYLLVLPLCSWLAILHSGCATNPTDSITEPQAYERAIQLNTTEARVFYIKHYPNGPHITEIKDLQVQRLLKKFEETRNIPALEAFIEHSDRGHIAEAQQLIVKIRREQLASDFARAKQNGDIAGLRSFLSYPEYASEANDLLEPLLFGQLEPGDYPGLQRHLERYPASKTSAATQKLIEQYHWVKISQPSLIQWHELSRPSPTTANDLVETINRSVHNPGGGIYTADKYHGSYPFLLEEIIVCQADATIAGLGFKVTPSSFTLKETKRPPATHRGTLADTAYNSQESQHKVVWIVDSEEPIDEIQATAGTVSRLLLAVGSRIRFSTGAATPFQTSSEKPYISLQINHPTPGSVDAGALNNFGEALCGYVTVFGKTLRNGEIVVTADGIEIQPNTEMLQATP